MLITCTTTPSGTVFRFYRGNANFMAELRPLVPLLLQSDANIEVCDDSDPELLLTVGPMPTEFETELVRRAKRYLAPNCPPTH